MNIARDPRFGRVSELPSEDPIHAGHYGKEVVRGMQEPDKAGHPLMLAYLKHYTAYSREQNRRYSEANISTFDLYDTYVRQYELAFKSNPHAPSGVMCSYAAVNGTPSCASDLLLNKLLRQEWAQPNALVTTDCGSIQDILGKLEPSPGHTRLATTPEEAAAWAIMNGTDLEAGGTIYADYLLNATKLGLASEAAVTQAARRALRQHFVAGRFDSGVWKELGAKNINSTLHQQVQAEAASQGMVLLKNQGILPLKKGTSIAVLGPLGVDPMLLSDYAGTGGCWPNQDTSCVLTIADAIIAANTGGTTHTVNSSIAEALAAARAAEVVVLALGNDRSVEHEGLDRNNINLPASQMDLATQVLALRKPTLLILSNGGAVAIDGLIEGSHAIVESFSPGHNTPQLAALLFGDDNRWGKLPVSIYSLNYTMGQERGFGDLPAASMQDYEMSASSTSPGRTYRYYEGRPLFEFGHGLSLTTFEHSCSCAKDTSDIRCSCTVRNTGARSGDEVVLVYDALSPAIRSTIGDAHPVPKRRLIDFERVSVAAGESMNVVFSLPQESLALTTADGSRRVYDGVHELVFSRGNGKDTVVPVTLPGAKGPSMKLDDSTAPGQFATLDCSVRQLALNFSRHLLRWTSGQEVFDALRLHECGDVRPPHGSGSPPRQPSGDSAARVTIETAGCSFFVAPSGSDSNHGSVSKPFASLHRAQQAVRDLRASHADVAGSSVACTVSLRAGVYYLGKSGSLMLEAVDSNTTWTAYKDEDVRISGGVRIESRFEHSANQAGVLVAKVNSSMFGGEKRPLMRLFVGESPAVWSRWPNAPPGITESELAIPRGRVAAAAPHRGAPDPWLPAVAGPYSWRIPTIGGPRSYFPGWYQNTTQKGYTIVGTNTSMDFIASFGGAGGDPYARFSPPTVYSGAGQSCPVAPIGLTWPAEGLNMSSRVGEWNANGEVRHAMLHSMHWSKPATCDGSVMGGDAVGVVSCRDLTCDNAAHCHHHGDGYWGALAWQLESVDASNRTLHFGAGGSQTTVGCMQAGPWFVEGLLAELDSPGEFYHSATEGKLYLIPNASSAPSKVVGSVLSEIVVVNGSQHRPVRGVKLVGLRFEHSRPHFDGPYPACGGGDFCTAKTGAVVIRGAEDVSVEGCEFHHTGGNAIAILAYNRRVSVTSNHFSNIGETPVNLQGDTDLIDATGGNFPLETKVARNLIHEVSTKLRGGSAIFQSLAARTSIHGNVLFSGPRAGINFNDAMGGGSVVESNLVFNFVRETADHGNENSWNRLPFVTKICDGPPSMVPEWNSNLRNFMMMTNFGFMSLDHDDGSSYWNDSYNFLVGGRGWTKHDGPFQQAVGNLQLLMPDVDLPFVGGTDPPSDKHSQCASVGLADTFSNNTCISPIGRVNNITECDPSTGAMSGPGLAAPAAMGGNRYIVPGGEVTIICGDTEKQVIDQARILNLSQAAKLGMERGSKGEPLEELSVRDIVAKARAVLQF